MTRAKLVRPVVVVPVVLVLAGGAVWLGFRSGSKKATAATAATQQLFTVAPTTLDQTVSASGTIAPADTEDLSFAVSGTVASVAVKAGQAVKKGQVLATLDSATLASALAQAQSTLAAAQASLSDDESAAASSAQLANDEAAVASAYAGVLSATADLGDATLKSPIAGRVATMNLTVGETLGSSGGSGTDLSGTGTGSGRVAASSSSASSGAGNGTGSNAAASASSSAQIEVISNAYVVNLSVDTTTVGNIEVGQSASVTPLSTSGTSTNSGGGGFGRFFAAGGGGAAAALGGNGGAQSTAGTNTATATAAAATGTVSSLGAIASSTSGVATFPVVVAVSGSPAGFHAGASASALITYRTYPNVLAVPVTAITRANGATSVTVSANGATSRRTVTTGITSGAQVEITSGLRAGEQVVVTIPTFRRTTGGSTGTGGATRFPNGGAFTGVGGGAGPGGGAP